MKGKLHLFFVVKVILQGVRHKNQEELLILQIWGKKVDHVHCDQESRISGKTDNVTMTKKLKTEPTVVNFGFIKIRKTMIVMTGITMTSCGIKGEKQYASGRRRNPSLQNTKYGKMPLYYHSS